MSRRRTRRAPSVRMDWRLGSSGASALPEATAEVRPKRPRRRRRGVLLAFYVAVLPVAALIGFAYGRQGEGRASLLAALEEQLAIEEMAWREGDEGLYAATLAISSDPSWRADRLLAFESDAPRSWGAELLEARPEEDRVLVDVEIRTPDGAREETRVYVPEGGRWLRAAPEPD